MRSFHISLGYLKAFEAEYNRAGYHASVKRTQSNELD